MDLHLIVPGQEWSEAKRENLRRENRIYDEFTHYRVDEFKGNFRLLYNNFPWGCGGTPHENGKYICEDNSVWYTESEGTSGFELVRACLVCGKQAVVEPGPRCGEVPPGWHNLSCFDYCCSDECKKIWDEYYDDSDKYAEWPE